MKAAAYPRLNRMVSLALGGSIGSLINGGQSCRQSMLLRECDTGNLIPSLIILIPEPWDFAAGGS